MVINLMFDVIVVQVGVLHHCVHIPLGSTHASVSPLFPSLKKTVCRVTILQCSWSLGYESECCVAETV